MDRYKKVEKPKAEPPANENEIRITSQGMVRNYISYATTLLQVPILFLFLSFSEVTFFLRRSLLVSPMFCYRCLSCALCVKLLVVVVDCYTLFDEMIL